MRKLTIVLLAVISCFSCGKATDNVPSVPVNFQAALGTPALSPLNVAGGAVAINGYGVSGLIIYRKVNGTYAAYDRCSSYQPEKKCAVTIDNTGFTVTDPCSGSKFSLEDGTPVKAPATKALRTYRVAVTQFEIQVTN